MALLFQFFIENIFKLELFVHNLILRVFISATRATAMTLTQAVHVAAKRGRGVEGSFVYKRVNC